MVARALNRAAKEQGKRLRKVLSDGSSINVVVMSSERRRSGLTIEQIEARTAKAKATREAKKAAEAAENPDRFKAVLAESLAKITG
jgi:leucyl aminopeptidase (aminopeptidase T)